MSIYQKKDAVMTRGIAILSMLILHLFCRKGAEVYGTPLIWLNETVPLVYYFGFFAEICVSLYSICAGYARELLSKSNEKNHYVDGLKKVFKLMINYWIILGLFCILGLIFDPNGNMPGSVTQFLKSIFLLHSYNGAWWYLKTYIIFMLIPTKIILFPVKKIKSTIGIILCIGIGVILYLVSRFDLWPHISNPVVGFMWTELKNLLGVLPMFWAGAFLCRGQIMDKVAEFFLRYVRKCRNLVLLALFILLFVGVCVIEKAVFIPVTALIVFILFNLWEKRKGTERIFLFLGKHSTNIWLVHMFFYTYIFAGLAQKAKYPIFMLLFLLLLCIAMSYVIMGITRFGNLIFEKMRKMNDRSNHYLS